MILWFSLSFCTSFHLLCPGAWGMWDLSCFPAWNLCSHLEFVLPLRGEEGSGSPRAQREGHHRCSPSLPPGPCWGPGKPHPVIPRSRRNRHSRPAATGKLGAAAGSWERVPAAAAASPGFIGGDQPPVPSPHPVLIPLPAPRMRENLGITWAWRQGRGLGLEGGSGARPVQQLCSHPGMGWDNWGGSSWRGKLQGDLGAPPGA